MHSKIHYNFEIIKQTHFFIISNTTDQLLISKRIEPKCFDLVQFNLGKNLD